MRNVPKNITIPIASSANVITIDTSNSFSCSAIASFSVNDGAGTLKFQASNRANAANVTFGKPILGTASGVAAVWVDIAGAAATAASGATIIIPKFDLSYQSIRLVWTRTGGTGNIEIDLNILGF